MENIDNVNGNILKYPIPITDQKWDKSIEPVVSIGCITYNHENYIKNAIEGFLIQKITFPVEIIIHDDASTDNTSNIIREYEQKYPNLFINIYQNENQYSKGNTPIFGNFIYPKARGKYIAFCEGDDFWTDPLKLQKQVNFLEANPDYSLTSHEAYYTYINDPNSLRKFAAILYHNFKLDGIGRIMRLIKLFLIENQEFWNRRRKSSRFERYSVADFEVALETASSDRYIPTLSIVARAEYLKSMPAELFKLSSGHRLIILWTALHGKQKHFSDVMGVKNTQENSVTVTKVHLKDETRVSRIHKTTEMYEILREYVDGFEKELIDKKIQVEKKKLGNAFEKPNVELIGNKK